MREAGGTLSRLGRQFGTAAKESVKQGAKFGAEAYGDAAESIGQGARESWAGITGKLRVLAIVQTPKPENVQGVD